MIPSAQLPEGAAAMEEDEDGAIPDVPVVDDSDNEEEEKNNETTAQRYQMRRVRLRNPKFYGDDWVNAVTNEPMMAAVRILEKEYGLLSDDEAFLSMLSFDPS
jgi:hypothetical protein